MEMTGEQLIPAAQDKVWRGLNDPAILKACITGCESIEKVVENEYKVALVAAVGPVKAKFTGKLLITDLNPPNSYSIAFEGSGGAAGFGKGGSQVKLAPEGNSTRLSYAAKASVGGKLAQIGSRLVDSVARKMADDFFAMFNAMMAEPAPAAGEPAAVRTPAAPAVETAEPATAFNPLWIVAVTVIVMLIISWAIGQG
jgi:carbon monoxide dehydrogenase subunit G